MDGEQSIKDPPVQKRRRSLHVDEQTGRPRGIRVATDLRGGVVHQSLDARILDKGREMIHSADPRVQSIMAINLEIDREIDGYASMGSFTTQEILLMRATRHTESALRIANAQKAIEELTRQRIEAEATSNTDPLLNIPNNRAFMERLVNDYEDAIKSGEHLAILRYDGDGLSWINNKFGHGAGNHMLQGTAIRLTQAMGPLGLVARTGGDEFDIVTRVSSADDALAVAERLQASLRGDRENPTKSGLLGYMYENVTSLNDRVEPLGGSIGVIVVAPGRDGVSIPEALERGDIALGHAKQNGVDTGQRGQIAVYVPGMTRPPNYQRTKA